MAIIIGVVLAIAISLSSARIQTINGDLNEGVKKTENRFCWTYEAYGSYYNLNAAISACKADENCGYIYDVDCDNYGSFQLCKLNAETQKSGQGSCIYKISKQKESCTCKDLISKWGYGNCQGTLDSSRGNVAICYVNQPSSCGDLEDSSTNPGERSSAEPCSQGSGYENPEVSSGLKELSTQLLTSTRAPTLQTTENIQSTQGNIPGHQSSHCRDQKIWCNLADCSLANVKRNCQKTCNLC